MNYLNNLYALTDLTQGFSFKKSFKSIISQTILVNNITVSYFLNHNRISNLAGEQDILFPEE